MESFINIEESEFLMDWYRLPQVKFNLIKYLYNRELVFLVPVHEIKDGFRGMRNFRCHNVQSLDFYMNYLKVFKDKRKLNLYYSVAKFKDGVPKRDYHINSFSMDKWNRECWKDIVAYDFIIDIDCNNDKEISKAYKSAQLVKMHLDEKNIPYELRFSGRGFHFVISYDCLDVEHLSFNPKDKDSIYSAFKDIAKLYSKKFSNMVDTTIYDARRIIKIPYSVSFYKNSSRLCLPLDEGHFNDFTIHKFHIASSGLEMMPYIFNKNKILSKKIPLEMLE